MPIHPLSRRAQGRYMQAFISITIHQNNRTFSAESPSLARFSAKKYFPHDLRVLESLGLISVYWINGFQPYEITVTKDGMSFFEKRASIRSETLWTRGLAIAALLISLVALLLEFDSRGYLAFLKPGKTGAELCSSALSQLQ